MSLLNCFKSENTSRPFLTTNVYGHKINALADTGSNITVISQTHYRQLPRHSRPKKIGGPLSASAAAGQSLQITGTYLMHVSVLGKLVEAPICVATNLNGDMILGMDFLRKAGIVIDTAANQCYLQDRPDSKAEIASLALRGDVVLDPGSAQKLSFATTLPNESRHAGKVLGVANLLSEFAPLVSDASLVETDQNGNISLYVVNPSVHSINIPKGKRLGTFERVKSDLHKPLDDILDDIPLSKPPKPGRCPKANKDYILQNANLAHMSGSIRKQFVDLLMRNWDVISISDFDLGACQTVTHKIHLKSSQPTYVNQFPIPLAHLEHIHQFVDNWLRIGVVKYTNSEFNTPMFLVPKKLAGGKIGWRPVLDYRKLNDNSYPSHFRLPQISECLDSIGKSGAKHFAAIDLRSGYHQMALHPASQPYTSFTIPGRGQLCWTRAPFGLKNLPLSFQRLMNLVFKGMPSTKIITYLDDILCMAPTEPELLETLQEVFDRLRAHKLKANLTKSKFNTETLDYLGFEISKNGYQPGQSKTSAIAELKPPETVREVRQFLGMANFFRSAIPQFSQLTAPLSALTRKSSEWTKGPLPAKALTAFNTVKKLLCQRPLLAFPQPKGKYHLYVDAATGSADDEGTGGLGAVLLQEQKGEKRVIAYASRHLNKHEKNYQPFLLEMQAITWAVEHFRVYLLGIPNFTIYTDHRPLTTLSKVHGKTFNRLQETLLEYNFDTVYYPGKLQSVADYLSRHPVGGSAVASVYLDSRDGKLLPVTKQNLRDLQRQDHFCNAFYDFAKFNIQPKDPSLKKLTTRFKKRINLVDGVVSITLEREGHLLKPVLLAPASLHAEIIAQAHAAWHAGHGGVFKTCERILQEYWWPGLSADVIEFIKECKPCQFADRTRKQPNAPLGEFDQLNVPLAHVHTDLFGPLKTSNSGKKFILVITDAFTKLTNFVAIPDKTPAIVGQAIFDHWICTYGSTPLTLTSDQGKEFVSNLSQKLYDLLEIDKRQTCPATPKCNGMAESRNKHVLKYLRSMLQDSSLLDWEQLLPAMKMSWNCSVSQATKQSPFFLLTGLYPRVPGLDPNKQDITTYGSTFVDVIKDRLKRARELAKDNNIIYRNRYKDNFDSKQTSFHKVKEGELVLYYRPELAKANPKLSTVWDGPYILMQLVGQQNAVIQHVKTNKTRYVNLNKLKPFFAKDNTINVYNNLEKSENQTEKSSSDSIKPNNEGGAPDTLLFEDQEITWIQRPEDHRHRPQPVKVEEEEPQPSTSGTSGNLVDRVVTSAKEAIARTGREIAQDIIHPARSLRSAGQDVEEQPLPAIPRERKVRKDKGIPRGPRGRGRGQPP